MTTLELPDPIVRDEPTTCQGTWCHFGYVEPEGDGALVELLRYSGCREVGVIMGYRLYGPYPAETTKEAAIRAALRDRFTRRA